MPLTRVRYLVRHAAQHGYLVASFKVLGAEEVQAVVSAAEAARAPAIVAVVVSGSAAWDLDMWFPRSMTAAALPEAAGCRIGVAADCGDEIVRPAAMRKHLQNCRERFSGDFVVDGDLSWPDGTFRALPGMGVVKINFDKRLGQVMAKANRQVAQRAGDHYRLAMDEVLAALADEVTDCLRQAGGTGRAADVHACALPDEKQPVRQAHGGVSSEQAAFRGPAEAAC